VPGIGQACLPGGRDPFGPGDHKIWSTSSITDGSVGRGSRIPVTLISPPVKVLVNGLLQRLGYEQMDSGSPEATASPAPLPETVPELAQGNEAPVFDDLEKLLVSRLSDRLPGPGIPPDINEKARTAFLITAVAPSDDPSRPLARWWRVDPATASLTRGGAHAPDIAPGEWAVAGQAQTWRSVLAGDMNLGTALRHGYITYSVEPSGLTDVLNAPRGDPHAGLLARLLAP
jgi:hypothetical protein